MLTAGGLLAPTAKIVVPQIITRGLRLKPLRPSLGRFDKWIFPIILNWPDVPIEDLLLVQPISRAEHEVWTPGTTFDMSITSTPLRQSCKRL